MVLFLAALFAYADAPNRVVETFDSGGTSIQALATSDDGSLIAAATSSGVAFIDTSTWQSSTWTGCDAAGVALQRLGVSSHVAYVGCDDGLVRVLTVAGERPTLVSSRDAEVSIDTLYAVHWDVNASRLYVLGESSLAFTPTLHVVDEDGNVDPTGFPVAVQLNGYVDSVISGTTLFIAHGGDNLSTYTLGSAFVVSNTTFTPYSISDLAPSIRSSAYGVDNSGVIIEYTGIFSVAIPSVDDEADAVGASDWADDEWLLVSRGTDVEVYDLANGAATDAGTPTTSFDAGTVLSDVVVGRIGYAFGVAGSDVVVMTANPWVDDVAVTPTEAEDGDELTLTFTTDTDVDYRVRMGSLTGTVLAEGESIGGDTTTVTLTVDETFEEGVNDIVVVATDSSSRVGSRGAQVSVDNPPPAPVLSAENVGFADGAVIVEFGDPAVDDLATYTVYVTTTPFEPSDFATGGPAFDGADALTTPISVNVVASGDTTLRVSPLTNDVTYYIAARAVDAGGQESPMSAAVPVTPRETSTALQRSGEEGGYACSHAPLGALGLPLLLVGVLTRRRRAAGLVAAGALTLVALPASAQDIDALGESSLSTTAEDEDEDAEPWWKLGLPEDETDAHWNVELHYGSVSMDDPNLVSGYGATTDMFQAEFGPQFFQVAELDFGVGYYREKGNLIADDGQRSSEETRFTMVPLTLDLTLRLHLLDEQPVVPFIRAGLDYTLFGEKTLVAEVEDDTEGTEVAASNGARGSKAGWHWAVGGQLLLDSFAPGRASKLEAGSGINDTWLVVEWRFVSVEPEETFLWAENPAGLDLSRSQLTVGLKLDF